MLGLIERCLPYRRVLGPARWFDRFPVTNLAAPLSIGQGNGGDARLEVLDASPEFAAVNPEGVLSGREHSRDTRYRHVLLPDDVRGVRDEDDNRSAGDRSARRPELALASSERCTTSVSARTDPITRTRAGRGK
jgi:hypothetical protein